MEGDQDTWDVSISPDYEPRFSAGNKIVNESEELYTVEDIMVSSVDDTVYYYLTGLTGEGQKTKLASTVDEDFVTVPARHRSQR